MTIWSKLIKSNLNPEKVKLKVLFLLKMIQIWMLCRGVSDFEQFIQHVPCCCWQIPYLPEVTFDTSLQPHICSLQWSWNVILWTSDITERLICLQILFFYFFQILRVDIIYSCCNKKCKLTVTQYVRCIFWFMRGSCCIRSRWCATGRCCA